MREYVGEVFTMKLPEDEITQTGKPSCETCVYIKGEWGDERCDNCVWNDKDEPSNYAPQTEERPAGCSKDWSASCTSCERYFSCDYLSGRKTDCGRGE